MPSRLVRLALHAASAAALVVSAAPRPALAAPPELTAEEYKLFKEYQDALGDDRVQKIPAAKRMAAIAKNFGVKEKELTDAIAKGEKAGGGIVAQCEGEVKLLLEAGALKGRIRELKVDGSSGHVVTFVSWSTAGDKLEEEAATAALAAVKGAPISSTVAVWAYDPAGTKVFEAKIAAKAAATFKEERIPMFAAARYIKQFDDVKNAYKGTPPSN
jgi:hypothetical protein